MSEPLHNWSNTYAYQARRVERPESVDAVREVVRSADRVHALGTRHSFNNVADSPGGVLVSTERLNRVVSIDAGPSPTVTIEPGVTYGQLGPRLHAAGYALPNLASLPHISVAGSVATATHGSGETLGCLATSVAALDLMTADGEVRTLRRADADFDGVVVHLGRLGVVTRLVLDLVPTFDVVQTVYDAVSTDAFAAKLDAIVGSAYSVSGFTFWDGTFSQVWMKSLPGRPHFDVREIGGRLADGPRHPLDGREGNVASGGLSSAACTQQGGVPGPWYERLPHFRLEFTPSSGAEIQSEYFVPREHAAAALAAVTALADVVGPVLQVSEVRFIAADRLWMSPFYERPSVGLHFTWRQDVAGVAAVLPTLEAALAPFDARPHWGKVHAADRSATYPKMRAFAELARRLDPGRKFASALLNV